MSSPCDGIGTALLSLAEGALRIKKSGMGRCSNSGIPAFYGSQTPGLTPHRAGVTLQLWDGE